MAALPQQSADGDKLSGEVVGIASSLSSFVEKVGKYVDFVKSTVK